jgi:hypothetical protein
MGTGIGRWDRRVHDEFVRGTNPNQFWVQRSAQAEPLLLKIILSFTFKTTVVASCWPKPFGHINNNNVGFALHKFFDHHFLFVFRSVLYIRLPHSRPIGAPRVRIKPHHSQSQLLVKAIARDKINESVSFKPIAASKPIIAPRLIPMAHHKLSDRLVYPVSRVGTYQNVHNSIEIPPIGAPRVRPMPHHSQSRYVV